MELGHIEKLEEIALNVGVIPPKRAFASGIVLMTYMSLRFSGVQRSRILDVNEDSAYGALFQSETKKPHGVPRLWACPSMVIDGPALWVNPIIDFRDDRENHNGTRPSFVAPRANRRWELEKAEPSAYVTTRRKLALLRV